MHLVFDKPNTQPFNPKQFKHAKRYLKGKSSHHEHTTFTPLSNLPQSWREHLECRKCKRSIIEAIGLAYLQRGCSLLKKEQKLILAGCFTGETDVWEISEALTPQLATDYKTNAEEADCRIWRHAIKSRATYILIYSPDTDVYNIGLGILSVEHKQYIVQLNVPHSQQKRYVHLNNLLQAFMNDPDLVSLPQNSLGAIMQALFYINWL